MDIILGNNEKQNNGLIDYVFCKTMEYIEHKPKLFRKKYGQFFTSPETAIFMAELLTIPRQERISILDPGAGSGMLSAALIARLENIPWIKKIELVCYENDRNILALLESNLCWISKQCSKKLSFEIVDENYILDQGADYNHTLYARSNPLKFDLVIGNPPYMKVAKEAPEALEMHDICHGAPNLYFLFAHMSLFNLRDNGEMVYIIPRSWTSGVYFKKFRQRFLEIGALQHIHLFVSRDKVFEEESVLQETMIIKVKKTQSKPSNIVVSTSRSNGDFSEKTKIEIPYRTVVSGNDSYVYLATNEKEIKVLETLKLLKYTLPDIGLRMKTGLTVDFRNRDELRNCTEKNAVPLFYSQHIKNGSVIFPVGKETEYIVTQQKSLLQKNTNYLFVKRFTAKEEHRRLQCGVYLSQNLPEYTEISTQNKINFICGENELSECIVYGLYALFNSSMYDCYYRILNGSTQVNSTEINEMPVPSLNVIEAIGQDLMQCQDMSEESCNTILRSYI